MLQEQIGEGGYGEVWLAAHEKSKVQRVFKFCFDPERVRGLRREVVLFRLLRETLGERDDIVQILDWQFDEPPYFLESEYTAAGDLIHWAETEGGVGAIPLETRLELVAQTAVALAAAHSVGVLHKDVKPSNILITEITERGEPRASLTDFGIGLITNREALEAKGITAAGLTQTLMGSSSSSQSGTRLYMAPEVIEGKPSTTLSDVFSLGVVLYQMVIGDFSRAVASGWERDVEDELLREDIAACVDGSPDRRLHSVTELSERLRSLEERRVRREATAKTKRIAEQARRRRKWFVAASCVGILVVAVTTVFALIERRLRDEALKASNLAQQRADEAEQVVGILSEMFTVSDPFFGVNILAGNRASGIAALRAARGTAVKATELLDRGAARISEDLTDQPVVQARLLNTVGVAYLGLGRFEKAESLLKTALEIQRSVLDPNHPDLAATLHNLAEAMLEGGKSVEVEPYLNEAVQIRREIAPDKPELAASLSLLSWFLFIETDLEEFIVVLGEANEILRKNLGEHPEMAFNSFRVAFSMALRGESSEATALSEEAMALALRVLPEDHPMLGVLYRLHGDTQRTVGEYEKSIQSYEESARILSESLGKDHPLYALTVYALGISHRWAGNFLEAQNRLQESAGIYQSVLGATHPDTVANAVNWMASIQDMAVANQLRGEYGVAEKLYRQAIGLIQAVSGNDGAAAGIATVELARLLKAQERLTESAGVYVRAIQFTEGRLGDDHSLVARYRQELDDLRASMAEEGKLEE